MEKKLKWNAIGFERKTQKLHDKLKEELEKVLKGHSKEEKKIQGFINELENLLEAMKKINKVLIPKLEQKFR